MRETEILENADRLAARAVEVFVETANLAIATTDKFTVALSGGSTPKHLYRKLSVTKLPWARVQFYFGDERLVPPDHPESNFRMAEETLFEPLGIDRSQIHRWRTELNDPEQIAEDYRKELDQLGIAPSFDLVLLGIGEDCHTASLFPNTDALNEETRSAVANWVPKLGQHRVTVTFPVINRSACVLVLASGNSKAAAVRQVLKGSYEPARFPIQAVELKDGREVWLLDKEAASKL